MLAGCQTLDQDAPADWIMKGRVVMITPDVRQRLSVYWRQNGEDFEVLLTGTLGASVARLVSISGEHYIDVPGEPRRFAPSTSELLYQVTGLNLPIERLVPVLNGAKQKQQRQWMGDWQIAILERDPIGRPSRIEARLDPTLIRLTVTEWR